jgi:NOL1/NOP2/fmu family ribosome biogenesis protein
VSGALKYDFPVCRFFPHRTRGEGFFLAVLRKPGEAEALTIRPPKGKRKEPAFPPVAAAWLRQPESFAFKQEGNGLWAYPRRLALEMDWLKESLHVLSAGLLLGESKGKEPQPSQALAMSTALGDEAFERIELDLEKALAYLRKESLPPLSGKGLALVTYRQLPLGFVNRLGNRANNLYPSEWRIRSRYSTYCS